MIWGLREWRITYGCCILFVVSYSWSHSVFGCKSFSLIFFYITELDLYINWASSVALLSQKLNYCIIVFSCHLGPSHSVPIISLACSGLHLVLPQTLLMAVLGWHLPPSCWWWVFEQNKFLFSCLFLMKTTLLSLCIVVLRTECSTRTRSSLWLELNEGEEGRNLDFGVCSDCLELLGLLMCGVGSGGVFSWDSTRPRYGMGRGAGWKATDASWSSCLWIPITPPFSEASLGIQGSLIFSVWAFGLNL